MTSIVPKCGHIHHLTLQDYGFRRRRLIQEWKLQHGRHDLVGGTFEGGHERMALIGFRSRIGEGLLPTQHLRFGPNKRIFHFELSEDCTLVLDCQCQNLHIACSALSDVPLIPICQDTTVSSLPYVRSFAIGGVDSKRLQKDQGSFLPCDETETTNVSGAPKTSKVKSIHSVKGESELRDARECSEEGSSRSEGNPQGEADDPIRIAKEVENKSTFSTEDDVRTERKRMGRPRKKKKKAYFAGIATYDTSSNSIRLKEETAPEVGNKSSPGATHFLQTEPQPQCRKDPLRESKPRKEGPRLGFQGTSKDSPLSMAISVSVMSAEGEVNLKKKLTRESLSAKEHTHLPSLQGFKGKHRNETAMKKDAEKGTVFFKQKPDAGARDSQEISKGVPELVRPRGRNDRGSVYSFKAAPEHATGDSFVETDAEVGKMLNPDSTQLLPLVTRNVGGDSKASDIKRLTGPPRLPWETNQEHALHFNYLEAEQQSTLDTSTTSIESKPEAPFGKVRNIVAENNRSDGNGPRGKVGIVHLNSYIMEATTQNADVMSQGFVAVKEQAKEVTLEVLSNTVIEQVGQVAQETTQSIKTKLVEPVLEVLPETLIEQVSQAVNQVEQVKTNASIVTEVMTSTAGQVAESVTATASHVKKSIGTKAAQVSTTLTDMLVEGFDTDDEFEAFKTSELAEFRGVQGLENYEVLQEDTGILVNLQDFYFYMLKKPFPEFAAGMFAAPIALSMMFTVLYMPQFEGLALDETARSFVNSVNGVEVVREGVIGLKLGWTTLFEVFMFSLSLSTGLQPELAPLSPYTLVVANLNALLAQLLFAFLSAAVFARLSQPSQPVKCSEVALICSNNKQRRQAGQTVNKALMIRCILTGPQPCELVDVKVDLMYNFNSVTGSGACFRGAQSLKLVRPQIAFLNHGMLVRHIIDEKSPLYCQSLESLHRDDTIFILSVTGTERSSMQAVFHVQYYSVYDGQVIWDAEFEDMILINQKNQRILDPSRLSSWRSV